jgi:hypothetical protein
VLRKIIYFIYLLLISLFIYLFLYLPVKKAGGDGVGGAVVTFGAKVTFEVKFKNSI